MAENAALPKNMSAPFMEASRSSDVALALVILPVIILHCTGPDDKRISFLQSSSIFISKLYLSSAAGLKTVFSLIFVCCADAPGNGGSNECCDLS